MNPRPLARLLLPALPLLFVAGCGKSEAQGPPQGPQGRPPVAVVTAVASTRDVPVYIDQIGAARASENVQIRPQASGRITKRYFDDGQTVKVGDRLFDIDPRPYQAALDSAKAQLAQNQAELRKANIDFTRSQKLIEKQAIGQQEFETDRTAYQTAQAKVQSAEAAIETAQVNLGYTEIRSPIDGRIGQRLVDAGNIVTANSGTALVEIRRFDPLYVDFTVPEAELDRVRRYRDEGGGSGATTRPATDPSTSPAADSTPLTVKVWLPDKPKKVVDGKLEFVDNAVAAQSGTVMLRATVPNADLYFWPGQFVQVRLVLRTIDGAVVVPEQAVQVGQDGKFLFVVKPDGTVAKADVTPGQRQGSDVVIEQGIEAGQRVVTEGQLMLSPGAKVKELNGPSTGPSTQPAAPDDEKLGLQG